MLFLLTWGMNIWHWQLGQGREVKHVRERFGISRFGVSHVPSLEPGYTPKRLNGIGQQ